MTKFNARKSKSSKIEFSFFGEKTRLLVRGQVTQINFVIVFVRRLFTLFVTLISTRSGSHRVFHVTHVTFYFFFLSDKRRYNSPTHRNSQCDRATEFNCTPRLCTQDDRGLFSSSKYQTLDGVCSVGLFT